MSAQPVAPGVVEVLREVWRRLDRLDRAGHDRLNALMAERRHDDREFVTGQVSGLKVAKEAVVTIAKELGIHANVPTVDRAVRGVTKPNEP